MGRKKCSFMPQFIGNDDVLFTITSSEFHGMRAGGHVIYDNGILRNLTFLECVRAQSFPDNYIFKGTQAQRYHEVGDAVPPLFAKAVAEAIKEKENE